MNNTTLARIQPVSSAQAGWMVSASHRSSIAITPAQPFGSWHARRLSDPFTACGVPAAGWPIFWHLRLAQGRSEVCVDCMEAMRAVAQRRVV